MRVRRRRYNNGTVAWELDYGVINGRRKQRMFKTKAEADTALANEKTKLQFHGQSAFTITESERIEFATQRDRLAAVGAKIGQAVDYYLLKHKPLKAELTLRELLNACVLDKELGGASDRYLTQFASSCRSFLQGRESMPAKDATREVVKSWILGGRFAPKTQRTYLGDVRTLFAWAVQERFLAENPIAGDEGFIQLSPEADREIESFDVEHCERLLYVALLGSFLTHARAGTGRWSAELVAGGYRPLIGYLVVALFCGVRPDELKRTTVAELDVRERALIIEGKRAKTRQRRVIELPRVAIIWLRLWRRLCPGETRFLPLNFERKWKALRKDAAIGKWPHDALRHTAATFHFAAHRNAAQLQAMLGHSEDEDTLYRHYRAVRTITGRMVTKKMAEGFWSLTPRCVRLSRCMETAPAAAPTSTTQR